MAHRLINWSLLRDLMCANRETSKFILESSYKEMNKIMNIRFPPPINDDRLKNMITGCGCNTISQDGFEACLVTWKSEISPLFRSSESPEFEQFLTTLDDILVNVREKMVEKHQY